MKQADVIEFQMLNHELEQVQQFLQKLDQQSQEVTELIKAIEEFHKLKEGSEIWFPIANGLFAQGILSNTNTLKINVGKGVIVNRTIKETTELIQNQLDELINQQKLTAQQQEVIYDKLEALEKKVRKDV